MPALIDDLKKIADEFSRSSVSEESEDFSLSIANALRWTSDLSDVKPAQVNSASMKISRGSIGVQPAVVFAVGTSNFDQNLLNEAAFYAYHASIPWGLVASRDGAVVFNSHWLRRNEWFHLPFMKWDEAERNIDVFEAITPERIRDGNIERVATRFYKPDHILRTVDDVLVERLDYWRDETLRYSKSTKNVDENLQKLFAQLFVLRTVEDRCLAPDLASLRTIYSASGEVDLGGLHSLLQQAKEKIGSELFEINVLEYIPENVLGGIINDLYTPYNLPSSDLRYNFAWIDADVLGLAYEKYLATVLTPANLASPLQLSLFQQPVREVERISVRKSLGVYYTPNYLVKYLTESCLNDQHINVSPDNIPRIADFACGSGSFLVAVANSLIQRLRQYDPQRNWARELVSGKHIIGIDIDKRAVTMARLALWLRFAEEPHPLPLPHLEEVIIHGDSLSQNTWSNIPNTYDVILGNPPFLATGSTPKREELSLRFRAAQGKYDYSYLFVELAVNHLSPNGILGMIIPNRLFRNRDAEMIREVLTDEMDLITIVDFGSNEVFKGTSAYIGAIVAGKTRSKSKSESELVRVINVLDLSPRFLSFFLWSANKPGVNINSKAILAYDSSYPRGRNPWLLISESDRRIRTKIENESEEFLGEVAGIYQGIRTGANDIFVVEIESKDNSLAKIINGLGDGDIIENELLHPVIFGSEIQKYGVVTPKRYLIYPYKNNNVILENDLKNVYPRTYEYLSRYQSFLVDRGTIVSGGLKWYELARKRDMSWLQRPKLIIRDLATETSFSIDQMGDTYLVGGTAVVPSDSEMLLPLLAYLNSQMINHYLSQITPTFRGGFQKFEPQHLQRIPVLRQLISDSELAYEMATKAERIIQLKILENHSECREVEEEIELLLGHATGINQ